ncbi:MAG TPA: hypothetical protein VIW48_02705, partial [Nitrospiraceae bacterium]
TVVAPYMDREFYEKVVFSPAPRTLEPDRLSFLTADQLANPFLEWVNGKYVISDGTRTLDVYPLPPFDHTADMMIVYLPRERMVVNADIYEPAAKGAPLPKPNPGDRVLLDTIQRLGLDVSWDIGLHSGIGPHEDLLKIVGQATTN